MSGARVILLNLFLSLSLKTVFEFTATAETAMDSGLPVRLNNLQIVEAYHRAALRVLKNMLNLFQFQYLLS